MLVLSALSSALCFGVADYMGGRASKSHPALVVTLLGQSAALVALFLVAWGSGVPVPGVSDWAWGGAAGIAGSTGLIAFYRAMGSGYMTVAAPVSAVITGAIPIGIGLLQGERPGVLALVGMPIALVAVVLVSDVLGPDHRRAPRWVVLLAAVSGAVFGSLFVMLDQTSGTSGAWPVVAMRAASVPYMVLVVTLSRTNPRVPSQALPIVLVSGVLDSLANALFLFATRQGLMSVVAVILALYPASTLLLAVRVDREKIHGSQAVGLAMAATALVLVAVS